MRKEKRGMKDKYTDKLIKMDKEKEGRKWE